MNNLLVFTQRLSFGESLIYALIGFAIVFAGIAIIIACVWAIGKLINAVSSGEKNSKAKTEPQEPIAAPVENIDGDDIPLDIRLAITVAVYCCLQEENSKCEFVVRKIKRI